MLLDAVLQRRNKVDPVMRIILTVFTFLCGMLAHAAHLAPWDTDGDGARAGMAANGGGVVACRVSCGGVESFPCDLAGNLLSASNSVAAETFAYDGAWNLALELMASNPNFRNAGVQNVVYQAVVDEWGSPLKRLGAYDNAPIVGEPEMVNAIWDLGAATTAYRNLGANEPVIKATTGRATTDFIGNAKVTSFGRKIGEGTIDVRSTIDGIKNGTIKERATFLNTEGLLPIKGPEYYREYVLPTPTTPKVGPQRIIQGRNGELYYSPDHYHSFVPLN